MRVLITGGKGFLGSNLVEYLSSKDYEILVASRTENNDENSILNFKPEVVIHLAWDGGNSYADVNNVSQIHKNIPQSAALLETLRKLDIAPHFIGFGTFVEYGLFTDTVDEEYRENPVNFYGLAKNCFKGISKMYCEQNNMPWTWIRPCYVYGPKDVETRLIPGIIVKLLSGKEVVLNSCDTTIDYLYVHDFCTAMEAIIQNKSLGVYNVCSGKQYVLKDVINTIKNIINPNRSITFDPALDRKYSSKFICGDNHKLKVSTGWKNCIDLEEGINKTIQYYNERQSSK